LRAVDGSARKGGSWGLCTLGRRKRAFVAACLVAFAAAGAAGPARACDAAPSAAGTAGSPAGAQGMGIHRDVPERHAARPAARSRPAHDSRAAPSALVTLHETRRFR